MRKLVAVYKCKACENLQKIDVSQPVPDEELSLKLSPTQFNIDFQNRKLKTWVVASPSYVIIDMFILKNCMCCTSGLSLFDLVRVETQVVK